MVAVYKELFASTAVGVKVATLPAQPTVPPPRLRRTGQLKVVAGESKVAQFIASLKVALSTWVGSTPVAPFAGTSKLPRVGAQSW